jgi:hypothetical protein
VLDAVSVQVNRRARQAKTDRLDLERLMNALMRHDGVIGWPAMWCMCRRWLRKMIGGRDASVIGW